MATNNTAPTIEEIKAIFNTVVELENDRIMEDMMDFNGTWEIVHQNNDGLGTICTVIKLNTDSLCDHRFIATEYSFQTTPEDGNWMQFEYGYTAQNKGYMGERFNKPHFWGKYYSEVFH